VILEEAPETVPSSGSREYQLIVVSARSRSALERASHNLAGHLREREGESLADVAYTLQVGRRRMKHRRMMVCRDAAEAIRLLESNESERVLTADEEGEGRSVVFMFPGQGSQYVNMGLELYQREEEFARQVRWCSEVLMERVGIDLLGVLYPPVGQEREAEEKLNETRMTQPALFVVEYAMAKQLEKWGIRPDAMIGHSLGEYVAACLAGVMSIEDALWLVSKRGELMQGVAGGGMLAVMESEEEAEERIRGRRLSIAAVNGRQQVVISGEERAIEELMEELKREGKRSKKLNTRHAYHSSMMDEVAGRYVEEVRKVRLKSCGIEYISNLSGKPMKEEEVAEAGYWGRQMRERVRFGEGIEELTKKPGVILIEVGPGELLSRLARQSAARETNPVIISTMRNPTESRDDSECLTTAVGKFWMAGGEIDWNGYYQNEQRRRIELPTYPFERQRYWIEAGSGIKESSGIEAGDQKDGMEAERVEAEADVNGRSGSLHSRPALSNAYAAPSNNREKTIAAIWQAALGVDKVGVNDNFFALGGDSLIAIQVISQLKEEFKIEIPVADLYERLTIRSLCVLIGSLMGEDGPASENGADSVDRNTRVLQRKRFQEKQRLKRNV